MLDAVGGARALKLMAFYPPYLGAGIRVDAVDPHLRSVSVSMALTRWNRNAVGVHFGGSLYSLCDPWFMLLLMARLGSGFTVWDKRAAIEFRTPGRGRVSATFAIDDACLLALKAELQRTGRAAPIFFVDVNSVDGTLVCRVEKLLTVRRTTPPKP